MYENLRILRNICVICLNYTCVDRLKICVLLQGCTKICLVVNPSTKYNILLYLQSSDNEVGGVQRKSKGQKRLTKQKLKKIARKLTFIKGGKTR